MELSRDFRTALADRYEIVGEIGEGAMASVYLARDLRHDREVALKVMRPDSGVALSDVRFAREIKFVARLQHPHILPLHDSGRAAGHLYYVMPLVRGTTLRARLDREHRLPVHDAVRIACEVADALDYAHRHGVIHRDIKPENVMLSGGHALIVDFGIARAIGDDAAHRLTSVRSLGPGTPAYMSPEQLVPGQEIDGRTDIYSLGVALYEALVGERPFRGPDGYVDNGRKMSGPAPSVRAVRPEVPDWVDRAVMRALAPAPEDRHSSALELARALRNASDRDSTGFTESAPDRRRSFVVSVAIIAALLAAGAVVAGVVVR